jgi:uncharacterized protein YjlB
LRVKERAMPDKLLPGGPIALMKTFASQAKVVPGRRPFFEYRNLGLEEATQGRMRGNLSSSIAGMPGPTGWHYHDCEVQFVYLMRGTIEVEFEDGTVTTFRGGDAFLIPGGTRHNELHVSDDKVSIEICIPGQMGTVACERPAHLPPELRPVSGET